MPIFFYHFLVFFQCRFWQFQGGSEKIVLSYNKRGDKLKPPYYSQFFVIYNIGGTLNKSHTTVGSDFCLVRFYFFQFGTVRFVSV